MVVASRERKPEERILGGRWDILRDRACEGFSLRHVQVVDVSREVAEAVAREAEEGGVVVTCDALVVAMAADAGALALDDHGREQDDPGLASVGGRLREVVEPYDPAAELAELGVPSGELDFTDRMFDIESAVAGALRRDFHRDCVKLARRLGMGDSGDS